MLTYYCFVRKMSSRIAIMAQVCILPTLYKFFEAADVLCGCFEIYSKFARSKEFQKITLHQKKEIIIRPIKVQMKICSYRILDCYTLYSLIKLIGLFWLMQ